jgi:adenosyl cobinamide kinase/adenosyl cobinamide phosphate guanylyltransferase
MSATGTAWRRVLVLGGIRSGKSEFAEDLVADAEQVRYVATARRDIGDAEWAARIDAHRARRLGHWRTTEIGDTPLALTDVVATAESREALLVDDLGGWVGAVMETTDALCWPDLVSELGTAVSGCAARLVLVSPEVGLSLVPATAAGRAFADSVGMVNRSIAAVCDVVVLVVAGNAVAVKGTL